MVAETAGVSKRNVSALLFLTSAMTTLDAFSALNSSPWTAESFGADEKRATALQEYVNHAVIFSMGYAVVSAAIAESAYPIVGALIANAYLVWLYDRARKRAEANGNSGWADGTGTRKT